MTIKRQMMTLILFAVIIFLSTIAAAHADGSEMLPTVNRYGLTAPFLMSWLPIWVFAIAGGVGSLFIKLDKIDVNFRHLYIAKPFLGAFGGVALCLVVATGREPPEVILTAYAFAMAFFSAPLLQGGLVLMSSVKNQTAIINKISPVQFEAPDEEGKK